MSFFSKRSTAFVVMVVVILSCLGYGQSKRPVATPPPGVSGSQYLLDDAAVLSADTQKYIAQMNNDLFSKTGAQGGHGKDHRRRHAG